MKADEKISSFKSLKSLIHEIEKDRQSLDILNRRYAVRFIMLDNFNLFQQVVLKLTEIGISTYDLEDLLEPNDRDAWITKDLLTKTIKCLDGDYIISPFSEIVRFYEEEKFRAFFNEISLLENTPDKLSRRIYIPLIGLENRFRNFLNSFGRIEESAPVWALESEESQPVTVFLTPSNESYQGFKFPKEYKGLDTMYDWLIFWKTKAPTDKIICSSFPINVNYKYSQPDNIFDIKEIKNAYEFITQFLKISIHIEYKASDESFWVTMLASLDKNQTDTFKFKKFVNKQFNVYSLTIKDILDKWSLENTKEFDRWLLKHYYLLYLNTESIYLTGIIKDITDYYKATTLLNEVTLSIFSNPYKYDLIADRKLLLNTFDENVLLSNSELEILKSIILDFSKKDTSKAIAFSTGRFYFERELIISWYLANNLNFTDLQNLYPDLAAYLNKTKINCWANDYIQAYKKAKLSNTYTDEVKKYMIQKNASEKTFYEWYYKFPKSIDLLAQTKPDKIYWLDGVGIEYLSLIQTIINNSDFKIKKFEIATSTIPSSTEYNHYDGVIKRAELDSYIHASVYKYPESLCKGIDIVKRIIKDILNESSPVTIAIVSDHGLSSLSRLVDSKKYISKSSHEGRYIQIDSSESLKDSDYVRYKNNNEYFKVALTHASLNSKPIREVHGGCTPEEVLVPFILITNKEDTEIVYVAKLVSKDISILSPEVQFKISPHASSVFIQYNGLSASLVMKDNIWQVDLEDIKIGLLKIEVIIDNSKPQHFDISIIGGLQEEELF